MRRLLLMLILAIFSTVSISSAQDKRKETGGPPPQPGELVFKGDDGTIRRPILLGTQIGTYKIRGIDLSLNVLRATHPEKLKADSPDHIFNVVLTDKDGKSVKNEKIGLVITGDGKKQQLNLQLVNNAYYQGMVRLDQPGKYQVSVELRSKKKPESTPPFSYEYEKPTAVSKEALPSDKSKTE